MRLDPWIQRCQIIHITAAGRAPWLARHSPLHDDDDDDDGDGEKDDGDDDDGNGDDDDDSDDADNYNDYDDDDHDRWTENSQTFLLCWQLRLLTNQIV